MFPSLSAVQDDKIQLKRMVRRAIVTSSFLILPLMAGLAAMAKPVVKIVLGEKWLSCVPFVQIECFIFAFWPIHTSNLSAINALGRSDIFLKLEVIKKILGVSCLIAFFYMFHSAIGIALGGAFSTILGTFINANPNKKLLNYGYFEQMKDIGPSFILSLVMGLGLWWLTKLHLSPVLVLILLTFIGALFYLGVAKLLHFECLDYLIKTLQGFRNDRR